MGTSCLFRAYSALLSRVTFTQYCKDTTCSILSASTLLGKWNGFLPVHELISYMAQRNLSNLETLLKVYHRTQVRTRLNSVTMEVA